MDPKDLIEKFGLTGVFIVASYLLSRYFIGQIESITKELTATHKFYTEELKATHHLYAEKLAAKDLVIQELFDEVKEVFKNSQTSINALTSELKLINDNAKRK